MVLQTSTVVTKPRLPTHSVLLHRLHLTFESVIDTLTLVYSVVQSLRARD